MQIFSALSIQSFEALAIILHLTIEIFAQKFSEQTDSHVPKSVYFKEQTSRFVSDTYIEQSLNGKHFFLFKKFYSILRSIFVYIEDNFLE